MEKSTNTKDMKGWVFFVLWAVLIVLGIIEKRVFGHPDMMVFFHLPAAVFLVLAGYELSRPVRAKYREALKAQRVAYPGRQLASRTSKDG